MTTTHLFVACALDIFIGDPPWFPHPVKGIGWLVGHFDHGIRNVCASLRVLKAAGIGLAAILPVLVYLLSWFLLNLAYQTDPRLGDLVTVFLAYTTLSARDLADHAWAVFRALTHETLDAARSMVSRIVGRDTVHLPQSQLVRATVETVAENTSDGIVAPLFYLFLGGPPLAMAYKTINTLDSMIGHRTPIHQQVGWASARLDDLANLVPSRMTALLLAFSAGLRFGTGKEAWRLLWRDGHKHASPNSGWPEAAVAGGLGIQLGGINYYQGQPVERPLLGNPGATLAPLHIKRAVELMWITFGFAALLAGSGLWL